MTKNSIRSRILLVFLVLLTGAMVARCVPPEQPLFSFVVIADPHIEGDADHDAKFSACVDWVNTNKDANRIELVFVGGDIAWGTGQPARAKQILDGLTVPYLPLIGNHEVQGGSEQDYDTTFTPQYDQLATVLENWSRAPTPVWNPDIGDYSYFQNFSFDYKGLHVLGLDWVKRGQALLGEGSVLNDVPGGTWEWFTQDITNAPKDTLENIVMFSHHPMTLMPIGAFSEADDAKIENFTAGYGDNVASDYAGHLHVNLTLNRPVGKYAVYVTAAPWVLPTSVRLVGVHNDGTTFTYTQQVVIVQ